MQIGTSALWPLAAMISASFSPAALSAETASAKPAAISYVPTLFGSPADPAHAQRTVPIELATKAVQVASGEVITFTTVNGSATWQFSESLRDQPAQLATLLPQLSGAAPVWIQIARSRIYSGG